MIASRDGIKRRLESVGGRPSLILDKIATLDQNFPSTKIDVSKRGLRLLLATGILGKSSFEGRQLLWGKLTQEVGRVDVPSVSKRDVVQRMPGGYSVRRFKHLC